MEDRISPGMLASTSTSDPSDIKVEPDALSFSTHASQSSLYPQSRASLSWQQLPSQYIVDQRRPQTRKRSQTTTTNPSSYTNKYLRLNPLDRRRSTGASRSAGSGPAEASASMSHTSQAYTTWNSQETRGVYQSDPSQSSSPTRRSSDGDQYPQHPQHSQHFAYGRGNEQDMSNRRTDMRPHSVHSASGSSSLSGAIGPPIIVPPACAFSSTPSPVSDISLRHADSHVGWVENAAGLVAASTSMHPLSSAMTAGDVGMLPYQDYSGQNYLDTPSNARSPIPSNYGSTAPYFSTSADARPPSQHSPAINESARPMHASSSQSFQSSMRNALMDMSSANDSVEMGSSYSSGPSMEGMDQEMARLRARVHELEVANSFYQHRLFEAENERQATNTNFAAGNYSATAQPAGPASPLNPEFRASWRVRTDARIKRFCSLNRAGNALCAWHDSRRERRAYPPRMAPPGYLNCGCSVDEALFEESLSRHNVGSYHPGEMVRMDPALRNPLLKLLQQRYGYKDGDFERDPNTGGWREGEGPDVWEQSLQAGGSGTRSRRS